MRGMCCWSAGIRLDSSMLEFLPSYFHKDDFNLNANVDTFEAAKLSIYGLYTNRDAGLESDHRALL